MGPLSSPRANSSKFLAHVRKFLLLINWQLIIQTLIVSGCCLQRNLYFDNVMMFVAQYVVIILLYMMMIYFFIQKSVHRTCTDHCCRFVVFVYDARGVLRGRELGDLFVLEGTCVVFVYIFYCAKGLRVRSSVAVIIVHTSIISH